MKKVVIGFTLFVVFAFAVFGQDVNDFAYKTRDNGITITGYKGSVKDVVIPESINGLPVDVLDSYAFAGAGLTSVVIPNSVKAIGIGTFLQNQLTSVNIPPSVKTIGDMAFTRDVKITRLSESEIDGGYDDYNDYVERRFEDFEYFTFENGRKINISKYTGTTKDVVIPERINGLPVASIGGNVFRNKGLTSVIIPNSVVSIEFAAFANNQLTSVVIPNSVKTIGVYAFGTNKLTTVIISNSIKIVSKEAFSNNQLTSIVIPNSVESIENFAFDKNRLTSVVISNSVKYIGAEAFSRNQLTSVVIPNSVKTIGNRAFDPNVKITRQ